jgi:hypothetical protein
VYEGALVLSRTLFSVAFRILKSEFLHGLILITNMFQFHNTIHKVLRGKNMKKDVVMTLLKLENE